jgi:hypothetical protein
VITACCNNRTGGKGVSYAVHAAAA